MDVNVAKDDSSKIPVGVKQGTIKTSELDKLIGIGTTYQHSEATRSTENEALKRPRHAPRLNKLQKQIALLERIGRDPQNWIYAEHPVFDRPARPIYGSALWAWIGHQPGITLTAKEVRAHLERITEIEELRAEMGLKD